MVDVLIKTTMANKLQSLKSLKGRNTTDCERVPEPPTQVSAIPSHSGKKIASIAAAVGLGMIPNAYVAYDSFKPISDMEIHELQSTMSSMCPNIESFEKTKNTALQVIKDTGLEAKGLKLIVADGTIEGNKLLDEALSKESPKVAEVFKKIVNNGCNAAFCPETKSIIVNDKLDYEGVYHEIGHALNKNGNFFTKSLNKATCLTPYCASIVAPIVLGVAIFHKVDKSKPKEQKGKIERTLDFVANNAGKLTLASYLPILSEEALASIRGINVAKKYLKPSHISKLKGSYAKMWSTYGGIALAVSGSVGLANIIIKNVNKKRAD